MHSGTQHDFQEFFSTVAKAGKGKFLKMFSWEPGIMEIGMDTLI